VCPLLIPTRPRPFQPFLGIHCCSIHHGYFR
jgi:hypothetical protein